MLNFEEARNCYLWLETSCFYEKNSVYVILIWHGAAGRGNRRSIEHVRRSTLWRWQQF